MTIHNDYEVSSEGAVRHWEIPYARLEHVTPDPSDPACVLSLLPGTQVCGVVLSIDAALSIAVIDFTASMVTRQNVRNVLTYNAAVENTWGVVNIGDPISYDRSAVQAAADVFLTTSPLDQAGVANPLFGHVVPAPLDANFDTDAALFPRGIAIAPGSLMRIAVMQCGAGR